MRFSTLSLLASIAGTAIARNCQNLTISVSITARNGVFNVEPTQNNIEVTNFILDGTQQGHNATAEVLTGYADVSGTYNLAATYCTPDSGAGRALQILTHGIGFDRSYWDVPFNNYNYSYVAKALEAGYSTLTYDRLGIGQSARADPIADIQSFLEIASLAELTKLVKAGSVSGIPTYSKIYHAGHSFGSVQTYALIRDYPDLSSGAILQGFSQNGTFLPYFQLGGNFVAVQNTPLASQYSAGYFAAGNPSGVQTNFFSPGMFDPNILEFAYSTGQPVSQGELLSIGGAASGVNNFAGPVLIITGGRDVPFCGGDCTITGDPSLPNIPSSSIPNFPNTKAEVVIVPEAGHGLNLEYSAPYTYSTMLEFLSAAENGGSWGPVKREWRA
jgi:pimeloyl-ACP methyl ester carboxylesterase